MFTDVLAILRKNRNTKIHVMLSDLRDLFTLKYNKTPICNESHKKAYNINATY